MSSNPLDRYTVEDTTSYAPYRRTYSVRLPNVQQVPGAATRYLETVAGRRRAWRSFAAAQREADALNVALDRVLAKQKTAAAGTVSVPQPDTRVTLQLTQVEASLVAEYIRAAQGPIGHRARLGMIALRLENACAEAAEQDHAIRAQAVAERERLAALADEATEAAQTAGYNHANYANAYGGALETEESLTVPDRFAEVYTHYTAAYLEGQQAYEDEQLAYEDESYED